MYNSRSTMYYGGLQADKLARPLRRHYSADGSMEIKQNIATGATEFLTYIGGDAYSAPIVLKSNGTNKEYLYLHRDYQGTILAISNQTANVVEKRLFDAWGQLIKVQDGQGNILNGLTVLDRGYTGHEHLQSVGLIHMNGRLYDAKLHRFLQPDNFIQDPYNTQNYNRYGYVLNNPLKYTDPSGEIIPVIAAVLVGAVIGAATYTLTALLADVPFSAGGFLKAAFMGGLSGAVSFGVGEIAQTIKPLVTRFVAQAFMHGTSQAVMAGIQGGDPLSAFVSGSLSSIAAGAWSGGGMAKGREWKGLGGTWARGDFVTIAFGTISGGAGAALSGGNFWQGAATGLTVSGLNHAAHAMMDDQGAPPSDKEIVKRFKKGNIDPWGKPDLTKEGALNLNKNVEGLEQAYNDGGKPNIRFDITSSEYEGLTNFGDVNLNPSKITNNIRYAALLFHEYRHAWQYHSGNYYYWQKKYGYGYVENYMERDAYWFQIKMGAGSFFDGYSRYAHYRDLTKGITYK